MSSTQTTETIEKLQDFQSDVQEMLAGRHHMSFQVGDLAVKENTLTLDGKKLDKDSTKKVLAHLKVRPDFLSLHKKMSEDDWESVAEKLKSVHANQPVYGRISNVEGAEIQGLHLAHKKSPNGGIQIPEVFALLNESLLNSSDDDFFLKEAIFDDAKDEVLITLLNTGKEIDVFGSGQDMWKAGKQVRWTNLDFNISPFLERLVCTNGNVAKKYGFSANVSKSKYNFAKISSILEKEISHNADTVSPILIESAKHLKRHNVSIKEFLTYRRMFESADDETNPHAHILQKYFNIETLNKAYKTDIESMHNIWKSTADTGKNAYDFFNDLTYIASHPNEIKIDTELRRSLQIKASDLLFKDTLDLELVAPKLTWK